MKAPHRTHSSGPGSAMLLLPADVRQLLQAPTDLFLHVDLVGPSSKKGC